VNIVHLTIYFQHTILNACNSHYLVSRCMNSSTRCTIITQYQSCNTVTRPFLPLTIEILRKTTCILLVLTPLLLTLLSHVGSKLQRAISSDLIAEGIIRYHSERRVTWPISYELRTLMHCTTVVPVRTLIRITARFNVSAIVVAPAHIGDSLSFSCGRHRLYPSFQ
jgi:hypothetical protein